MFIIGGYIVVLVIIVVCYLGLLVIFYEFNVLLGKVMCWFSCLCNVVVMGFEEGIKYLVF